MVRSYRPLLVELGLTYPQYVVRLMLWEADEPVLLKFIAPAWVKIAARSRRCSSAWKSRPMWSTGATLTMTAAPSLP